MNKNPIANSSCYNPLGRSKSRLLQSEPWSPVPFAKMRLLVLLFVLCFFLLGQSDKTDDLWVKGGNCLRDEHVCYHHYGLKLLNKLRAEHGVALLESASMPVFELAVEHSKWMAGNNTLLRNDLHGINQAGLHKCGEFLAAEIVAMHRLRTPPQPPTDVARICLGPWMRSPSHVAALTIDRLNDASLGAVVDGEGRIWCTLLMSVNTHPGCSRPSWPPASPRPSTTPSVTPSISVSSSPTPSSSKHPVWIPEKSPVPVNELGYIYHYHLIRVVYSNDVERLVRLMCVADFCRYCDINNMWCYSIDFSLLIDMYLAVTVDNTMA